MSLTHQAITVYGNLLKKTELFRSRTEIKECSLNRPGKADWFQKSGDTDVILNVPPSQDQELLKSIRNQLSKVDQTVGTRVRPQQSYGSTILNQIMTRRLTNVTECNRQDCLVCVHEGHEPPATRL